MVKKEITYENPFTGEEVTETFYFNISKAEYIKLEAESPGGLKKYLEAIVEAKDNKEILATFEKIIKIAYLKREGDRPVKNEEIWLEFYNSNAYSELVMDFFTNPEEGGRFIAAIAPDLSKEVAKLEKLQTPAGNLTAVPEPERTVLNPTGSEGRVLTQQEVIEMDREELARGLKSGELRLP